jgi:hypothetical protein
VRAVSLPIVAGFVVRAIPVVTTDFPLNDGGLFYAMTRDLQESGFLLPAYATYNGLALPFAYPPLAFYIAGILSNVTGIGLLELFQFLPLVLATLTIPVVYVLAREILATRFQALLATWAFALVPRSFDWLIVGGGITRSLGLLLAVLTVVEGIRFYKRTGRRHGVAAAILAGLTSMSHPQAALFAGLSLILVWAAYGCTWRSLRDSVGLVAGAAVVASPWWISVIATHGVGPYLSGGQTSGSLLSGLQPLVTFTFTDEPYLTLLAVVGLIGLVHQVAVRRYLLPAWLGLVFVIDPRSAATSSMVPMAMLIAVAVDEVLLARIPREVREAGGAGRHWPREVVGDRFGRLLLGVGLTLGVIGAVRAPTGIGSPLHALAESNRTVMSWIADNAPLTTDFVVVSAGYWNIDVNSEWFPALTGHRSLGTVQGFEWLGKAAWDQQLGRYGRLQGCADESVDCIREWMSAGGVVDAWVYVPNRTVDAFSATGDCCGPLRRSLAASPDYEVAFSGPGGDVFRPTT